MPCELHANEKSNEIDPFWFKNIINFTFGTRQEYSDKCFKRDVPGMMTLVL
jgi:hypothetical protein